MFQYFIEAFHCFPLCPVRQSETLVVCDVDEQLVERLKKFRLRTETNNAAIISKCRTYVSMYAYFSKLI